jgi:hypothetical protein
MASSRLTGDNDATVLERLRRDPDFRAALEQEYQTEADPAVKFRLMKLLLEATSF